jgi:FixJ family two-component response regulator
MSTKRPIVAIVDDDPRLIGSLENLLESAGYGVRAYASAGAMLGAGLSDIDLLITDIGMPAIDGFELRERVRMSRPDLPVFLVTGRHEIADQVRARGIGGFFRKPFDAQALLAAVASALSNHETEGEHEN